MRKPMSEEILEALTSHPNWEVMNPIGDNPEPNLEDPAVAGWMWHTVKVQLPKGSVIRRLWSRRGESVNIQLSGNRASKRNLWFEQNDTVSGVLAAKALLWLWMRRER